MENAPTQAGCLAELTQSTLGGLTQHKAANVTASHVPQKAATPCSASQVGKVACKDTLQQLGSKYNMQSDSPP